MNIICNKKLYWVCIAILIVLSLFGVFFRSLTIDELNTLNLIEHSKLVDVLTWIRVHDTQMPLFYIIADILYPLTSFNEFTVRLPSILFVYISIAVGFKHLCFTENNVIAKKYLLLSITSLILFKEGFLYRPYGLLFLLSTLSFVFLERKKSIYFFITLLLLSLTHYFGFVLAIFQYIKFIITKKSSARIIKTNVLFLIFLSIFSIVFFKDILNDFFVIHTYRTLSLKYILNQFIAFNSGAIVLFAVSIIFFIDIPKELKVLKDLVIAAIITVLCLIKAIFSPPIIEARYFIIMLYPYLFLISKYSRKSTFSVVFLASLLSFYTNYPFDKSNTKKVVQYINNLSKENNTFQVTSCDLTLKYYLPSFKDCYNKTDVSSNKVFYISNIDSPSNCHCFRVIKEKYQLKSEHIIKNLKVLSFEKN